jgi:sarcosine oxidase subunit alpha
MPRLRPPRDPVTLHLDGAPVLADRGEPAAVALIAAGHLALARSPKFHRPRGPACLRAACDGCLARVDDEPNVMTCRVPAAEGMRIETQNVVGTKDTDLLRVADWFFPEGMNHHELLAGVPGLQRVLQGFARRVAGLGKLPARVAPARGARRREVDALVVGAGPGGMAAAVALAAAGREVEVVDDDLAWGGSARILQGAGDGSWAPALAAFGEAIAGPRVRVAQRTTAAGVYGDDVVLARDGGREAGVEVVRARTLVLAPGAHDAALAFEGNDVPGVLSARAGCRLLAHGVVLGAKVVVVCVGDAGPFARAYAAAHAGATLVHGIPLRASGSARAKAITVATASGEAGGELRIECDAVLVDGPTAPAYEVCEQAGAELSHQPRGFLVRQGGGGRLRDGVFAVGEVVGTPLEPRALALAAEAMAEAAQSVA